MQTTAGSSPMTSLGRARLSWRCWLSGLAYSMLGSKMISPALVQRARTRIRIVKMKRFIYSLVELARENSNDFPLTVLPCRGVRYGHEPQIISKNIGDGGFGVGWRFGISIEA